MRINGTSDSAECFVFSYKDGVLSAMGHDLKMRVERFSIDIEEDPPRIEARFDTASLRVVCAMSGGVDAHGMIGASDREKIERSIVRDVLRPARHPEALFTATRVIPTSDGWEVRGTLVLNGCQRPITVPVRRDEGRLTAEVRLCQPDFGIKPFSAMLGTLRIQPMVIIRGSALLTGLPVVGGLNVARPRGGG